MNALVSSVFKRISGYLLPQILIACIFTSVSHAEITVERLNNSLPIINQQSFTDLGASSEGSNINGPSVIRVPDWLSAEDKAHPNAVYYMFFGHHSGKYIRLAWATEIEGPWTIFNVGSNNDPRVNGRGVLDLGSADKIEFPSGAKVNGHIASPDVIVDNENKQFVLYFHGPANSSTDGDKHFDTWYQKTLVATSKSGLNFNCPDTTNVNGGVGGGEEGHGVKNSLLGNAYFRTFSYDNELYAFSNYGPIWKAPNTTTPWNESNPKADAWQEGPLETNPIFADLNELYNENGPRAKAGNNAPRTGAPRHFATHLREDGKTLEVWYTSRGDMPERIFSTIIDLSQGDWQNWDSVITNQETVHTEMLRPEVEWEGVNYPLAISANGSESGVNQLRDPALFQDSDGKRYLFYSGAGEEGIGLAAVTEEPTLKKLTVTNSTASDQQSGNPAENVLDNNLDTRWSSKVNGTTLTLDLDDFYSVSSIQVATFVGDSRKAFFDLEYSLDGTAWDSIGSFETSGTTLGLEEISFAFVYAKHIRLIGRGNSNSAWNSYTEIELYGSDISLPSPAPLGIIEVVASNEQNGNHAANILDDNLDTRWSSNIHGATLTFTLDSYSTVTSIQIAAFAGESRLAFFDLETSEDGSTWTSLGSYETSGNTNGLQSFDTPDKAANFIRLSGFGNSSSKWNSYTEIKIIGIQ